jgi:hypothetical protein
MVIAAVIMLTPAFQAVARPPAKAKDEARTLDQKAVRWIQSAYKTKCVNQSDALASSLTADEDLEASYVCGPARLGFKTRLGHHGPFIWNMTFQSAAVPKRHLPTATDFAQHLPDWLEEMGLHCASTEDTGEQTTYECRRKQIRPELSVVLKQQADTTAGTRLDMFFYEINQ